MATNPQPGSRIVIIGTSGSGKTTFAIQLAERLGLRHVEADALHWEPGWTEASDEVFRERARQATSGQGWVLDGNYGKIRDIVWPAADTVVWLDYPLPLILWRLWWRSWHRILSREELWNGNRESFKSHFLSRDSLFLWVLKTYRRRRREYPVLFQRPEYAHLKVVRLRSPRETEAWLARVEKA